MKPEKKPFIVEIKNRRRQFQKQHSIWENIDLKAAGGKVVAEQTGDDHGVAMPVRQSEASIEPKTTDINA
jgi:hypothetical protein